MPKTFKADNSVQGAMIQADYCLDAGDDDGARRWQTVVYVQKRVARVWTDYERHWSPMQLRRLPARLREIGRYLGSGRRFCLHARFSPQRVAFTLTRNVLHPDGRLDEVILDWGVTRKVILRNPDRFFRSLAVSIVTRTGPLAIAD